jgi:hypothetical protein
MKLRRRIINLILAVVLLNLMAVSLIGCRPSDTDVSSLPAYNFSTFTNTVWRTKVKTALADMELYTGRHALTIVGPQAFENTHPNYYPPDKTRILVYLPVGTRLRIARLMRDNGNWGGVRATGFLDDGREVNISEWLLARNTFFHSSSSTNWGVSSEMLEPAGVDIRLAVQTFTSNGNWSLADVHILRLPTFARNLCQHRDPVSAFVWTNLSGEAQNELLAYHSMRKPDGGSELDAAVLRMLVPKLNQLIRGDLIYTDSTFAGVILQPDTRQLLFNANSNSTQHLNRMLLEDAYPGTIAKSVRIVTEGEASKFALVDYTNRVITFYNFDNTLLSKVDLIRALKLNKSLPSLPEYAYGTTDQIWIRLSGERTTVTIGKVTTAIDPNTGKLVYLGSIDCRII